MVHSMMSCTRGAVLQPKIMGACNPITKTGRGPDPEVSGRSGFQDMESCFLCCFFFFFRLSRHRVHRLQAITFLIRDRSNALHPTMVSARILRSPPFLAPLTIPPRMQLLASVLLFVLTALLVVHQARKHSWRHSTERRKAVPGTSRFLPWLFGGDFYEVFQRPLVFGLDKSRLFGPIYAVWYFGTRVL
jgi:hypothetical protein